MSLEKIQLKQVTFFFFIDTTDLCFICDTELNYNNRVQLTTTHAKLSNKSLPEIFAGVLGEEYFVVILNENDYACKNCASLLNRVEQLERDLKLVKNAVLTIVKKKHGLLIPDKDDQVFILLQIPNLSALL